MGAATADLFDALVVGLDGNAIAPCATGVWEGSAAVDGWVRGVVCLDDEITILSVRTGSEPRRELVGAQQGIPASATQGLHRGRWPGARLIEARVMASVPIAVRVHVREGVRLTPHRTWLLLSPIEPEAY